MMIWETENWRGQVVMLLFYILNVFLLYHNIIADDLPLSVYEGNVAMRGWSRSQIDRAAASLSWGISMAI